MAHGHHPPTGPSHGSALEEGHLGPGYCDSCPRCPCTWPAGPRQTSPRTECACCSSDSCASDPRESEQVTRTVVLPMRLPSELWTGRKVGLGSGHAAPQQGGLKLGLHLEGDAGLSPPHAMASGLRVGVETAGERGERQRDGGREGGGTETEGETKIGREREAERDREQLQT